MACGACGKTRQNQVTSPSGFGQLDLGGEFAGCDELYVGPTKMVVVVDRNGPNQRIFPGYELGDAALYAALHNYVALETVNANRLCAAAVADVPAA